MCVVMVTGKDIRVPEDWVVAGYEANNAGAGIAYRDKGQVRWKKGMNLEEAVKMNAEVPTPYTIHFRIPTCGGPIKKLTHPFPIEPKVDLALEGLTKGFVLFHNGHWTRWKENMLEAAQRARIKIPNDKWSDSRAMAWMAAHFGLGVLELIDEKVCAFGPDSIELFGTWIFKEGIYVSNTGFDARLKRTWDHKTTSWVKTDKESKDDKEDSHSPYLKPPASMMGDSEKTGRDGNNGVRYLPASTSVAGHQPYCKCWPCEQLKKAAINRGVSGGAPTETPFDLARLRKEEADRLWKMRPPKISKKKWKKAHKLYDQEEAKVKMRRIADGMQEFQRNVKSGVVLVH